jgi:hypothetical protein
MEDSVDHRRDIPRRIVVTLVDRAIAQLPPRAQMRGSEVADLLLDLRRGIDVVERLPWPDDLDVTPFVRAAQPDPETRRRRRLLFRWGRVSESTEPGE